jgi:hypothetical protein
MGNTRRGMMDKERYEWLNAKEERNEKGELTPLAMALDAISDYGCDCGVDEPGTCLPCLCENALRDMHKRLFDLRRNALSEDELRILEVNGAIDG